MAALHHHLYCSRSTNRFHSSMQRAGQRRPEVGRAGGLRAHQADRVDGTPKRRRSRRSTRRTCRGDGEQAQASEAATTAEVTPTTAAAYSVQDAATTDVSNTRGADAPQGKGEAFSVEGSTPAGTTEIRIQPTTVGCTTTIRWRVPSSPAHFTTLYGKMSRHLDVDLDLTPTAPLV